VVNTGLGVIGDIGKKTYNILMEDDDSSATGQTNVCIPFLLYHLLFSIFFLIGHVAFVLKYCANCMW